MHSLCYYSRLGHNSNNVKCYSWWFSLSQYCDVVIMLGLEINWHLNVKQDTLVRAGRLYSMYLIFSLFNFLESLENYTLKRFSNFKRVCLQY